MKNHILPLLGITSFLLLSHLGPAYGIAQTLPSTEEAVTVDTSEFVLKGITRNGDTGENFDHIYVDIYKILEDGSLELVRADRYPGGKFAIWLRRNERYLLKMNYNNRAFLEGFLNPADAQIIHDVLSQIFILDEYQPAAPTAQDTKIEAKVPAVIVSEAEMMDTSTRTDTIETAFTNVSEERIDTMLTIMEEEVEEEPLTVAEQTQENASSVEEASVPSEAEEIEVLGAFYVFESTSFREEATHRSGIILRFAPGNQVELLERTNQYWWKVRFKGKIGWVKAAKLQQDWF